MHALILIVGLWGAAGPTAPDTAPATSTPTVALGTGIGLAAGAAVGGVVGGGAFLYGFHFCAAGGCSGSDNPYGDIALYASPFLFLAGLIVGGATGGAIGANVVDGDVWTATLVGGAASVVVLAGAAVSALGVAALHAPNAPVAIAGVAAGTAVSAAAAGVLAQLAWDALRTDPPPPTPPPKVLQKSQRPATATCLGGE